MTKDILKLIPLPKDAIIYDLGCGDGEKNRHLHKYRYTGIDKEFSGEKIFQEDYFVFLHNKIAEKKEKADLIISEFSLQFEKNPFLTVQLIHRALTKGGYLYLACFDQDEKISQGFSDLDYDNMLTGLKRMYFKRYKVDDAPHKGADYPHEHSVIEFLVQNA